jgi:hypothetical protein
MSKFAHLTLLPCPASPELDEILKVVESHLDTNGVSLVTQKELQVAESDLIAAKEIYISNLTILETMKLLLAEQHSDEPSPKLGGALRTLDSLLSVAELAQSLDDVNDQNYGSFALTVQDFENAADLNRDDIDERIQEMRHLLLPILETRFRRTCEGLATFCDVRPGFSFGRTSAIPDFIKSKKDRLTELQKQNEVDLHRCLSMLIEQEQVRSRAWLLTCVSV